MVIQFQLLLIIREDFADFVKVHFVIENEKIKYYKVDELDFTALKCEEGEKHYFEEKKVAKPIEAKTTEKDKKGDKKDDKKDIKNRLNSKFGLIRLRWRRF